MRLWGQAPAHTGRVREPAVAGRFYPGGATRLAEEIDGYLAEARLELAARGAVRPRSATAPAARLVGVIVPHAGTVYSGPTAGYAYASIDPDAVDRVVVLGPAHHVPVDGIGLSTAVAWRTPLGDVELDADVVGELQARLSTVRPADVAHAPEHSLEVQLPFLQRVLGEGWRLVPLLVGTDQPSEVAAAITWCAALQRTLVVVSTDLSHYLDYEAALAHDSRTIRSIVRRRAEAIGTSDACGRHPLRGLLTAAEDREWTVRLLDARNSGDTAGTTDRVVGYAAFAVTGAQTERTGGARGDTRGSREPGPLAAATSTRAAVEVRPDPARSDRSSVAEEGADRIGPESRARLLTLARQTIEEALPSGRRPRFDAAQWNSPDPVLREQGAAFVTLRSAAGDLLGCIGSLTARQSLVADVAEHAFDAAFRDPRFPPMTPDRARDMVIDISVLRAPRPFPCGSYSDLVARAPVGRGVVVHDGRHRATFLPAVWEQLPEAPAFLAALWRKAGLAPGSWTSDTTIEVYDSEEFAEG